MTRYEVQYNSSNLKSTKKIKNQTCKYGCRLWKKYVGVSVVGVDHEVVNTSQWSTIGLLQGQDQPKESLVSLGHLQLGRDKKKREM